MAINNRKAIMCGQAIRSCCPSINLHVPAEHEDFVLRAYQLHHLSEDDILDIDCRIIDDCKAILYYNHQWKFSHGMQIEYNHAQRLGLPGYAFTSLDDCANGVLSFLDNVLTPADRQLA